MKQQRRFVTIAALALALGLIATPAWAQSTYLGGDFKLTNSSGGTITYGCGASATSNTVSNGSSTTFGCSSGTFSTKASGSTTVYSVDDACTSTQRHHTTASAGSSTGTLSLSHTCESL